MTFPFAPSATVSVALRAKVAGWGAQAAILLTIWEVIRGRAASWMIR